MAIIKFKRGTTYPTCLHGEPAFITTNNQLIVGNASSGVWIGAEINPVLGTSQYQLCTHSGIKTYVDTAVSGVSAGTLTGATLASNVLSSSLTSVGTLSALTVTAPISGSITGNSATTTTNANLTGHITSSGNAAVLGSFTSEQLRTALTDETGTGSLVFATNPVLVTPNLGTPSDLVGTNISGTGASFTAGAVTNANLTGEVTTSGLTATVANSAVIGKVLTGYTSGAGTVAATDTILQAIQKLNGNAGSAAEAGTLTGATLAANVLASSLTSVGTLSALTVTGTLTLGTTALISSTSATDLVIKSAIPAGTGVTPTIQIICPSAAFTLQNQTATQPVFNTPQDTITLQAATTYMVEGQYLLQTGTTSHTTSISFVSSGAITAPDFAYTTLASMHSSANASTRTQETSFFTTISGGVVYQSGTLANTIISFKGILRSTDAGTLVPNISFGSAPGSTNYCLVGSYLRFYPIGASTIDRIGTAIG